MAFSNLNIFIIIIIQDQGDLDAGWKQRVWRGLNNTTVSVSGLVEMASVN
jgi:hypothetical protein